MTILTPGPAEYPTEREYPSYEVPAPGYTGQDPETVAAETPGAEPLTPFLYPATFVQPGASLYPSVGPFLPPDVAAATQPDGSTLDRLWQLSNYDPFFYRGLAASAGYIPQAWLRIAAPPPQIKPWIPPRRVPGWASSASSVGLFESEVAGEFGSTPGSSF